MCIKSQAKNYLKSFRLEILSITWVTTKRLSYNLYIFYLIRKYDLKNKNIAIVYSLVTYQINDFLESVQNHRDNFCNKIIDLDNKEYIFIQSEIRQIIQVDQKTIILCSRPELILTFISLKKQGFRIIKTIKDQQANFSLEYRLKLISLIKLIAINFFSKLDLFSTNSCQGKYNDFYYFSKQSRKYVTHCIHYSQNNLKIRFKQDNGFGELAEWLKNDVADIHWVWTQGMARVIREQNKKVKTRSVGSITFTTLNSMAHPRLDQITIFDVTPNLNIRPYNQTENFHFYTEELLTRFITDILEIKCELKCLEDFSLVLKPKRNYEKKAHSAVYQKFLNKYINNNELVREDPRTNLYDLISKSKFTISIPFTSTAFIGRELNVNSIFYYPYKKELENPFTGEVPMVYGKENLRKYFVDSMENEN
jgi:polysaccharide biosynthesis PFTS motif protein